MPVPLTMGVWVIYDLLLEAVFVGLSLQYINRKSAAENHQSLLSEVPLFSLVLPVNPRFS